MYFYMIIGITGFGGGLVTALTFVSAHYDGRHPAAGVTSLPRHAI
jgi:hypothetical protein